MTGETRYAITRISLDMSGFDRGMREAGHALALLHTRVTQGGRPRPMAIDGHAYRRRTRRRRR